MKSYRIRAYIVLGIVLSLGGFHPVSAQDLWSGIWKTYSNAPHELQLQQDGNQVIGQTITDTRDTGRVTGLVILNGTIDGNVLKGKVSWLDTRKKNLILPAFKGTFTWALDGNGKFQGTYSLIAVRNTETGLWTAIQDAPHRWDGEFVREPQLLSAVSDIRSDAILGEWYYQRDPNLCVEIVRTGPDSFKSINTSVPSGGSENSRNSFGEYTYIGSGRYSGTYHSGVISGQVTEFVSTVHGDVRYVEAQNSGRTFIWHRRTEAKTTVCDNQKTPARESGHSASSGQIFG